MKYKRKKRSGNNNSNNSTDVRKLTPRESLILALAANGFYDEDIAKSLNTSVYTINKHISHILYKLNAKNRTQATVIALHLGLLSFEEIEESCKSIQTVRSYI